MISYLIFLEGVLIFMLYFELMNDILHNITGTINSERKLLDIIEKGVKNLTFGDEKEDSGGKTILFEEANSIFKEYKGCSLNFFYINKAAIRIPQVAALAMIRISSNDSEAAEAYNAVVWYEEFQRKFSDYKKKLDEISIN
jgi:hypothetical protein